MTHEQQKDVIECIGTDAILLKANEATGHIAKPEWHTNQYIHVQ